MESIESKCTELREMWTPHLQVGSLLLGPEGHGLHLADMLAVAVLDRSLSLLRAFLRLVEDKNMVSAAILCRCQLDNAIRFFATSLTDDPGLLVKDVLAGSPIRNFKDRNRVKMTDSHLTSELAKLVPWVPTLYEQASGYVHLSEQHIYNSLGQADESGTQVIKIDGQDGSRWTPDACVQTIHSFSSATRLLLEVVEMWGKSPKRAAEGGGVLVEGQASSTHR
jgi:hypothetical protein